MDILIQPIELFGYVASLLVFITFCMKTLVWLRVAAIASNIAFIAYALGAQLYPILILHSVLLPLNLFRLWENFSLIRRIKTASREDPTADALLPFMQSIEVEKGQTIFQKGDQAYRLFYIHEGSVSIVEFGKHLEAGDIFGEIGLFAEGKLRTATARAEKRTQLCEIDRATVLKLYREHPEFGFAITRLVTDRLVENQNHLLALMAEMEEALHSKHQERGDSQKAFACQ